MTILIAPDKFKGTLSSEDVCRAIKEALWEVAPAADVITIPLADGGEGTAELLTSAFSARTIPVEVVDPLQRSIISSYGLFEREQTAFIEMAKASGLMLLQKNDRNPLLTTSVGTGQLIAHALEHGATKVILGIGGSATTDLGLGMAQALGYQFLDRHERPIRPIGKDMSVLSAIRTEGRNPLLHHAAFTVLCDVENPLYGETGAAYVFAPQKGASDDSVAQLDAGLRHAARVIEEKFNIHLNFPGAGAAGGMGAGAKVFLNAKLEKGFEFMARFTQLEAYIQKADLIITGEGRIDLQSLSGKVVSGVAALARKHRKKAVAFCGQQVLTTNERARLPLDRIISLGPKSMTHAFQEIKERAIDFAREYGIV